MTLVEPDGVNQGELLVALGLDRFLQKESLADFVGGAAAGGRGDLHGWSLG
jgi:hypothetical protein